MAHPFDRPVPPPPPPPFRDRKLEALTLEQMLECVVAAEVLKLHVVIRSHEVDLWGSLVIRWSVELGRPYDAQVQVPPC